MKPNCYDCEYRSSVPGSCHSCCKHPSLGDVKVVGHETGIRRGWFNHPYDFDPNWLLECNGFKNKQEGKKENVG